MCRRSKKCVIARLIAIGRNHVLRRCVFLLVLGGLVSPLGWAEDAPPVPEDAAESNYEMPDEALWQGKPVADVSFTNQRGDVEKLSDVWGEKPVFLTLVFSRCAGICSPYLGLLNTTVSEVGGSDTEYQMVVLSFDPMDSVENMQALSAHHGLSEDPGWTFGVLTPDDIQKLCRSVGFEYNWDETRNQFDHPAMTVAITDGEIVRISVGETISQGRFKEMLSEAKGEYVPIYPQPGKDVLFRCFEYDPVKGFTPKWGLLIMILPGLLAIGIGVAIFSKRRRTPDALMPDK